MAAHELDNPNYYEGLISHTRIQKLIIKTYSSYFSFPFQLLMLSKLGFWRNSEEIVSVIHRCDDGHDIENILANELINLK